MPKKDGKIVGCLKSNQFWITVGLVLGASLAISLGLGIQFGIVDLAYSEVPTQYEPINSIGNFNSRFERPRPPVDTGLIMDDLFLTGSVALVIGLGIASLTLAIRSGDGPSEVAPKTDDKEGADTTTVSQGIDVSFWAGKSASAIGGEDATNIGDKAPWLYDPAFRCICLVVLSTGSLLTLTFALFGQGWDTATLTTRVPYLAFEKQIVEAHLSFDMGIYGYNITMSCEDCFEPAAGGCGDTYNTGLYDSCGFYYNYGFTFDAYFQRRSGFGKFSNPLNLQFQEAIAEGMPIPIIEIQSAFILDGEKIRWQRRYIKCAYGTGVCLWFASAMWILTNITGLMWVKSSLEAEKVGVSAQLDDVVYKRSESIWHAFSMSILGISAGLLLACLTWETVRPGNFPGVAFEDGVLDPSRGWTWNLCMGMGILHLLIGGTLLHYSSIQNQIAAFRADPADDEIENYIAQSAVELS